MKQEIKELWVAALESEEYKQGRDMLRHEDSFCCLGVLCDLYSKATGIQWSPTEAEGYFKYLGYVGSLSEEVKKWAGLERGNPMVAGQMLTIWNDVEKADFKEIAQLIKDSDL